MRIRDLFLYSFLVVFVVLAGCGRDEAPTEPTLPNEDQASMAEVEQLAGEIARTVGWPAPEDAPSALAAHKCSGVVVDYTREVIVDDIAHYTFIIQIGPGDFDRIGLHRVVKERRPNRPERQRSSIFLLHGDGAPFRTAFLTSTVSDLVADDHNIGVYLAERDIDVWGIDLGWTLVPPGTEDFGFMADWGLGRDADDLGTALALSRVLRLFGGNGWRKMHLLGWSRGVWTGLAYLGEESQRPRGLRHVAGFIPVDGYMKLDNEVVRQGDCLSAEVLLADLEAGNYVDTTGEFLIGAAQLGQADPNGPSPFAPGFTNRQYILAVGTSTYQLFGMPWTYHLVAGAFDNSGLPEGLTYTETQLWFDFVLAWAPYQALRTVYEASVLGCDDPAIDLPYDDHLGEVTVPVYYIGAAGGMGDLGLHTLTLLGSTDVSANVVRLMPDEDIALDFAHVDIFNAYNAPTEVWEPLVQWIASHRTQALDREDGSLAIVQD